jgi:hypothetical protein
MHCQIDKLHIKLHIYKLCPSSKGKDSFLQLLPLHDFVIDSIFRLVLLSKVLKNLTNSQAPFIITQHM